MYIKCAYFCAAAAGATASVMVVGPIWSVVVGGGLCIILGES